MVVVSRAVGFCKVTDRFLILQNGVVSAVLKRVLAVKNRPGKKV